MAQTIRTVIMRGGTSRAVFLNEEDLPAAENERVPMILDVFGSPDRRQIDGLGGADPLTSKLAIIGRPQGDLRDAADMVYTFGQVGIAEPIVDWHSLCGNITAAVGVYGVEEGFVAARDGTTRLRVWNTNLKRHLYIEVPVAHGKVVTRGNYVVPGVPGSGARILVDFADTAGGATGALLPTGNTTDKLDVHGVGKVRVSLVDIGNAHVFVRADEIGLTGTETPGRIDADATLRTRLEAIRAAGAERMKMVSSPARAREESPATPLLGVVAPPADYVSELTGETVRGENVDLVSRLQFMQQTHKTYAGTSTVCTGVAAHIPGTVVNEVTRRRNGETALIGHPAGIIETETRIEYDGGAPVVARATLGRTARRIMEGTAFLTMNGKGAA